MSLQIIRTQILFFIALALPISISSGKISSPSCIPAPDFCTSSFECGPDSFCNDTLSFPYSPIPTPRCVPRLRINAVCRAGECEQGLTCADGPRSRCRLRASRGQKCDPNRKHSCQDSLQCSRKTKTCLPPRPLGRAGARCPCDFNEGFYCNSTRRMCVPRGNPGDKCNIRGDVYRCLGFCAAPGFQDGVCLSGRKEGQLCATEQQCDNPVIDEDDVLTDTLVCNIPKGSIGRCVLRSRLLTRCGAECDPHYDRCDRDRGLSCRATSSGRHVCRNQVSRFDNAFSFEEDRRQSKQVARGGVCREAVAPCETGTECREVPGVQRETFFKGPPPPRAEYCVRIIPEGGACGDVKDKFTTQCGDGLRCTRGTCVKAKKYQSPFDDAVTHAGLSISCADLPCAPGLVCERRKTAFVGIEHICSYAVKVVGKGQECTDRGVERRRCEDGLVCAVGKNGTSMKRCRVPRKVGYFCDRDKDCEAGLSCPWVWSQGGEQEERRCYDAKKALKLGQACDPKASDPRARYAKGGVSQARCVEHERRSFYFQRETELDPMRCLAKGKGFACRVVRGLYEVCNEAEDATCIRGLHCGRFGFCVPLGEA